MICETIKRGVECVFMKKTGCSYNGGRCYPIVDKCEGCSRITEFPSGKYCSSFTEPVLKWLKGNCPMATHVKKVVEEPNQKKLNPLKASKRSMGKRA